MRTTFVFLSQSCWFWDVWGGVFGVTGNFAVNFRILLMIYIGDMLCYLFFDIT